MNGGQLIHSACADLARSAERIHVAHAQTRRTFAAFWPKSDAHLPVVAAVGLDDRLIWVIGVGRVWVHALQLLLAGRGIGSCCGRLWPLAGERSRRQL